MLMHIIHVYMHLPIVHVNFDERKIAYSIKTDYVCQFPCGVLVQIFPTVLFDGSANYL